MAPWLCGFFLVDHCGKVTGEPHVVYLERTCSLSLDGKKCICLFPSSNKRYLGKCGSLLLTWLHCCSFFKLFSSNIVEIKFIGLLIFLAVRLDMWIPGLVKFYFMYN